MRYTDVQTTTTDNTTQEAQHLFFLEDKLERDFFSGFITEEEYEVGETTSFKHLGNSMGSKGNLMGDFSSPLSTGDPVLMSHEGETKICI